MHILPYVLLSFTLLHGATGIEDSGRRFIMNEPLVKTQTHLLAGVEITKYLYVEFEAVTKEEPKTTRLSFSPYQNEWYARIGVQPFRGLRIEAEHVCYHPELPAAKDYTVYYGGHNAVSITFDSRELR